MSQTVFTTTGGNSWLCPSGVTSVDIYCWGGGADGQGGGMIQGAPGGGGGGFSFKAGYAVTPGNTYSATVGPAGQDSFFGPDFMETDAVCLALGTATSGGATTTGAIGDVKYGGGNAADLSGVNGGGGGGAAGTLGPGGNAVFTTAGAGASVSGGNGGFGGTAGNPGGSGQFPGGGGGGGGQLGGGGNQGPGGQGLVVLAYGGIPPVISGCSGSIPLFMSSLMCAGRMFPSGDAGNAGHNFYPSGHWFNSDGGSGSFWPYVNTDPNSVVTDNDYAITVQSGFSDKPSRVWFTSGVFTFGSSPNNQILQAFNLNDNSVITNSSGTQNFCNTKEGWILTGYNPNFQYTNQWFIKRDNSDYSNVNYNTYDASKFLSIFQQNNLNFNGQVYDRKFKRVFYIGTDTFTNYTSLFSMNVDGTNNTTVRQIYALDGFAPFYLDIDHANNLLYVFATKTISNIIYAGIYIFSLTDLSYIINVVPMPTVGVNQATGPFSLHYGSKTQNLYTSLTNGASYVISPSGGAWEQIPLSIISSIIITGVDEWNNRLYIASGASPNNTFGYTGLSGDNQTILLNYRNTNSSTVGLFDIDSPGYKSNIDFNLTQLPPGFGTSNPQQEVTSAYVTLTGQEGFDWTNVYAKVLKQDLQTVIWENYPEACSQFPLSSGKITQNIGPSGTAINPSHNTLADWNNSVLRLQCYSLNEKAPSGNFKIFNVGVNVSCSGTPSQIVIFNINKKIPLFIHGENISSGSIPLYLKADIHSGIPLFIHGSVQVSGNVTLYISGSFTTKSLPLYILGPQVFSGGGQGIISLFLSSVSGHSGIHSNIPLYLAGNQNPTAHIPLFMYNTQTSNFNGHLPLFLAGVISGAKGLIPLYVKNTFAQSGITLYTKGGDTTVNPTFGTTGGTPFSSNLALFINRTPFVSTIPLFLKGATQNGQVTLYERGSIQVSGLVPLVMPKTLGNGSGAVPLTVCGW